jgi:hypothetical protein
MYTDGTTEPIIAIIGHPIAGNPSQLAIERSLHSLGLEWRVLSFDVSPDDVAKALDGFSVTGIAGVMIAPGLHRFAATWYAGYCQAGAAENAESEDKNPEDEARVPPPLPQNIDCLFRGQDLLIRGSDQQQAYVENQFADKTINQAFWLGDLPDADQQVRWPSDWNLFSTDQPWPHEIDELPEDDGTTLVIDFSGDEEINARLKELGYEVISEFDLQVGTLVSCIFQWTGRRPSEETIAEAIEEYFGV